jgi:hypothetical protein
VLVLEIGMRVDRGNKVDLVLLLAGLSCRDIGERNFISFCILLRAMYIMIYCRKSGFFITIFLSVKGLMKWI